MKKGIYVRKLLGALVATSMLLSSTVVNAEDKTYGSNINNGSIALRCEIAETYQIAMPAEVLFSYDSNTGDYVSTYTIKCKSCLLNGESVVIQPTSYSVTLLNSTDNSKKINAVVTQTIDTWTNTPTAPNEIQSSSSDWVTTTGTITIPRANYKSIPAGSYRATLSFSFTKTEAV